MTHAGPPTEPGSSPWDLHLTGARPEEDLIAVGADLAPGTILAAYRTGLFPMGLGDAGTSPLGWWSPDPRGVLLPGAFRATRSLRRSARRFEVSVDTAFEEVIGLCASIDRDGGWITDEIVAAYTRLHDLGWAHSVEVRRDGELVGGLYGLRIGGLFAGESMFHRATDASKVALMALVERFLGDGGDNPRLIDVQWCTPHLASLGVVEWPRTRYLTALGPALAVPWSPF